MTWTCRTITQTVTEEWGFGPVSIEFSNRVQSPLKRSLTPPVIKI
jgi:hypothetical protein